jgi:uncharacterized protein DUF2845
MSALKRFAAGSILFAASGFALGADDVMRCGGALVRVGMIDAEVVAKCGEPKSKEIEDVPIRGRGAAGGTVTLGTTRVERWTYDRGYGQFPALLVFEEGKLKSLELLTDR